MRFDELIQFRNKSLIINKKLYVSGRKVFSVSGISKDKLKLFSFCAKNFKFARFSPMKCIFFLLLLSMQDRFIYVFNLPCSREFLLEVLIYWFYMWRPPGKKGKSVYFLYFLNQNWNSKIVLETQHHNIKPIRDLNAAYNLQTFSYICRSLLEIGITF
jgi:hypothetical protein